MSDVLLAFESVEIRRGMGIVVSDFSLQVSSGEVVVLLKRADYYNMENW
jgi:hypothetical protein